MSFFDEIKKKLAEAKAQKEKNVSIQSLERFGSIEGTGLQETVDYSLDNEYIIIFNKTKNGKLQFIKEYPIDNVVDFKLINSEQEDNGSIGMYNKHDLEIALITGEKFKLCHIYFIKETDNQFTKISQMKKIANIRDAILAFASATSDEATKNWANSIYEQDGLLQVFDENGEISISNIEANIETIKSR